MHVCGSTNFATEQYGSFRQIGRNHVGQRQQLFLEKGNGIIGHQPIAAFGNHYRIKHNLWSLMRSQSLSHGSHHVLSAEHANLDGINTHIGKKRINLLLHKRRRNRHHTRHCPRVLRR